MNILGLSAFYHDSAACLLQDGKIIAAAQEERFTRKKHDASFPKNAVEFCLQKGGIQVSDLDYVGFYDKPFIKFERILETYLGIAPKGIKQYLAAIPIWLKDKLWTRTNIRKKLGYNGNVLFSQHHESHAASAFFPSPFQEAAIYAQATFGLSALMIIYVLNSATVAMSVQDQPYVFLYSTKRKFAIHKRFSNRDG